MQQLFHTGMKPRFDLYMGQIVSQRRAFNHADIHAATFDRRFPPSMPSALVVIKVTSGPGGCSDKTESGSDKRSNNREYPDRRPIFHLLYFGFPF